MDFRKYFKQSILCTMSCLFLYVATAKAEDPAPVATLRQVAVQMIDALEKNKGHLTTKTIDGIVHQVLLPHVDLESMSRSVVGRDHWMRATPEQKEGFKREFTNLVIQVYSTPLSTYNGEKIEFLPMRGDITSSRVQVHSVIVRPSGQRIPVNYRLINKSGAWKVYDFSVEGVSMINSYRSQFDTILSQKGMAGLLQQLNKHNKRA